MNWDRNRIEFHLLLSGRSIWYSDISSVADLGLRRKDFESKGRSAHIFKYANGRERAIDPQNVRAMSDRAYNTFNYDWFVMLTDVIRESHHDEGELSDSDVEKEVDNLFGDLTAALESGGPERLWAMIESLREGLDVMQRDIPEQESALDEKTELIAFLEQMSAELGPLSDMNSIADGTSGGHPKQQEWQILAKRWFSQWDGLQIDEAIKSQSYSIKDALRLEKSRHQGEVEIYEQQKRDYTIAFLRHNRADELLWDISMGRRTTPIAESKVLDQPFGRNRKHSVMAERYALAYLAYLRVESKRGTDLAALSAEGIDEEIKRLLGDQFIPARNPSRQVRERLLKDQDTSSIPSLFRSLESYLDQQPDYSQKEVERLRLMIERTMSD